MNVFDLVAILTLNKKGYEDGLGEASQEASTFGTKLKSGLGTVAKVGGASLALLGAGTVKVTKDLVGMANETAEIADHIDKQSQKIGVSAQAYQEWDFILTHSGASVDSLQASMKTLSTQAQKGAEEFEALGISQEEALGLSSEELFERVVKGLQNMEEGTERTAVASKLLGRGATELAPVLNATSDDIEAMRQQAHDLGKVLSDEAVKSGAAYEDSLYNLQTAIGGVKNKMASDFLPSLVRVMDGLTGIFAGDDSAVEKLEEGISQFAEKITEAIPRIAKVATNLIVTFGKAIVKALPEITKAAIEIVKGLVKAITDNLDTVVEVAIEVIMALIDGMIEALPTFIEGAINLVLKVVEKIPMILEKLIDAIPDIINMLIDGFFNNFPQLLTGLIDLVIQIVANMPTIIQKLVEDIPNIIKKLIEGFIGAMPQIVQGAIDLVTGLVTHLPEIIKGLIDAIPDILKSILSAFGPLGEMLGGLFGEVVGSCGDILGGLIDIAGGVLGEVGNVAQGVFNWIGTLMDDPAQALKDAFDGVKNYATKVFDSVKTIITGIFDLIDAKKAEAEAKARKEKADAAVKQTEEEKGLKLTYSADGNTSWWEVADEKKYLEAYGGRDALGLLSKSQDKSPQEVELKGEVTMKGVNNEGELVASADYVIDEVKKNSRMYGAGGS